MSTATFPWGDEQLTVRAPSDVWLERIADVTALEMSDGAAPARRAAEIEVRDDLTVRVHADEFGFTNVADLLIWLSITMSDVLMRKSGSFLLHAASLLIDGRVTLVFGRPHSGKSTLIWNAIDAGCDVLGDDLAPFEPRTGTVSALPRPPKKRIAADDDWYEMTVDEALTCGSDLCGRLLDEPSKLVPRSRHGIVNDWRGRYPVARLLLLRRHDGEGVSLEALDPVDRLEMLLMHARDWGAGPLSAITHLSPVVGSIVHVGEGEQRRALDLVVSP